MPNQPQKKEIRHMKFLDQLTKNEKSFQRIVGLSLKQVNELTKKLSPIWSRAEEERLNNFSRKRAIGGGPKYLLEKLDDKLIGVLLYYRQYPTQEFLGVMLGLSQSAVSRLLSRMISLIELAADPKLTEYLTEAKKAWCDLNRPGSWIEFLESHPELRDTSTDATEQKCYRSKNYNKQKQFYSGKGKQHTIKTQLTVASFGHSGRILDVSNSYPGSTHDKTILDIEKTPLKFPIRTPQRFDSGYQGAHKDYPNHYIIIPVKRPKGGELVDLEKDHNTAHSKRRVRSEHAIAKIKKFKVFAGLFRQPLEIYNQEFRNVAALINFKMIGNTTKI